MMTSAYSISKPFLHASYSYFGETKTLTSNSNSSQQNPGMHFSVYVFILESEAVRMISECYYLKFELPSATS